MKQGTLNNFSWKKKTNMEDINDAGEDYKDGNLNSQSIKQSALKDQDQDAKSNDCSDRKYINSKRKNKNLMKSSQVECSEAALTSVPQDQSQSQERITGAADTVLNTKKLKGKRKYIKHSPAEGEETCQQYGEEQEEELEEEFVYVSKKERVVLMKSMKKRNIIDSDETDSNEHNINNIGSEQQSSSQQSSSGGIRKKLKMEVDGVIERRQLIAEIEEDKVDKDGLVILHPVEYTPVKYQRNIDSSPVRLQSQRICNNESIQLQSQQFQRQERQKTDNMNNANNSMSIVIDLEGSDGDEVEIIDPQLIDRNHNNKKRKINIIRAVKDQQETKQEMEEYDSIVIEENNEISDRLDLVPIVAVFKGTEKQDELFINTIDNHDDDDDFS